MKFDIIIDYKHSDYVPDFYQNWFKEGKVFLEDFTDEFDLSLSGHTEFIAKIFFLKKDNNSIFVKYAKWKYEETTTYNVQQTILERINSEDNIIRIEFYKFKPRQIWIAGLAPSSAIKNENNWHKIVDYKVSYTD